MYDKNDFPTTVFCRIQKFYKENFFLKFAANLRLTANNRENPLKTTTF